MDKTFKSYEGKIEELNDIIRQLDSGDVDLSTSIEKFQEGLDLFKSCNEILKKAEASVKIIKDVNEKYIEENFER